MDQPLNQLVRGIAPMRTTLFGFVILLSLLGPTASAQAAWSAGNVEVDMIADNTMEGSSGAFVKVGNSAIVTASSGTSSMVAVTSAQWRYTITRLYTYSGPGPECTVSESRGHSASGDTAAIDEFDVADGTAWGSNSGTGVKWDLDDLHSEGEQGWAYQYDSIDNSTQFELETVTQELETTLRAETFASRVNGGYAMTYAQAWSTLGDPEQGD